MSGSVRSQVSAVSRTHSHHDQIDRYEMHPRFSYEEHQDETRYTDDESRTQVSDINEDSHQNVPTQPLKQATDTQYIPIRSTDSDDNRATKENRLTPRRPVASLALWAWELSALLIAIASFIAIVILLLVYQNKTLSSWGVPLSINAVVAILTALYKGCLALPVAEGLSQLKWLWFSNASRDLTDMETYDQASRGPWGSILLIVRQFTRRQRS